MNPERVEFESEGIRLVGDRWPGGSHPRGTVMLLHGGGQRRFSWHNTGARLAASGWTGYALDARGHGDSDWSPDGDYSMTALSGDLVTVLRDIKERVVLVGASMGGMTSLIAEGEIGGLARGLVLVDIVPKIEPLGIERIMNFMKQAPDGFASLDEVADAIAAYNPHRPRPKNVEGLRKNVRQRDDGRFYWHWDPRLLDGGDEPTREITYVRARAAASSIRVPTLIVHGGQSDIVSREGVDELIGLIPGASEVEVSAAGHMVAGDDNDVFTANLAAFLETLPAEE